MLYWQHLSWAILFSSRLFVLKQTHAAYFIPDTGLCINGSQTLYCFSGVTLFRPRSMCTEVSTNIYNGLSLVTGVQHIRNHCQQHLLQKYLALFTLPSMIMLIVILTGSRTIWAIVLWACVCVCWGVSWWCLLMGRIHFNCRWDHSMVTRCWGVLKREGKLSI